MTLLLGAVVAIYAVSVWFVVGLMTRTLWQERSVPVDPPVDAPAEVLALAPPSHMEQPGDGPAAKTA
ncbi:hypothetical protein [Flexivirga sp.]|uniref:hypothetical protein n=1 Tax=Flexivirga sp. TaxID=1962927 RepID=UPI003F820970